MVYKRFFTPRSLPLCSNLKGPVHYTREKKIRITKRKDKGKLSVEIAISENPDKRMNLSFLLRFLHPLESKGSWGDQIFLDRLVVGFSDSPES